MGEGSTESAKPWPKVGGSCDHLLLGIVFELVKILFGGKRRALAFRVYRHLTLLGISKDL
jgi:hypothetical protein